MASRPAIARPAGVVKSSASAGFDVAHNIRATLIQRRDLIRPIAAVDLLPERMFYPILH
jgi:hypothetical protein